MLIFDVHVLVVAAVAVQVAQVLVRRVVTLVHDALHLVHVVVQGYLARLEHTCNVISMLDKGCVISLVCGAKDMVSHNVGWRTCYLTGLLGRRTWYLTGLLDNRHDNWSVGRRTWYLTGLLDKRHDNRSVGQRTCYLTGLLDKRHDNWSVGTKDMLSHWSVG